MAHSIRFLGAAAVTALILAGAPAQAEPLNRSVDSVHQPVVDRTDYVFDVRTVPAGLPADEADRLAGWLDTLNLGYGDTVTVDDPSGWHGGAAQDGVGAVVAHYGLLVSHDAAPVTAGRPAPGTLRIVVSRAVAHVSGCPDWTPDPGTDYGGGTLSNYGCATAVNLAAMIANPQDLVQGRSYHSGDAMLSVKAIKAYRDADATGKSGLKSETTGGK